MFLKSLRTVRQNTGKDQGGPGGPPPWFEMKGNNRTIVNKNPDFTSVTK